MGKKRCFLGFLLSLFVFVFSTNAQGADGYTCTKVYDSCNAGYYLSSGECLACTSASNSTSTQSCTQTTCSIDNGTCKCEANAGSQTCTGNYTSGTAGSNGVSQCTGCSQWGTCSGCGNKTITCDAHYELDSGECKPCSRLNDTETENITGGTRTHSVTYDSTAGGSCTATYGDWTYSCSANYEYADGECKPCSRLNDIETEDITGGTRSRSVTYSSTAGGSCTATYGNWSYSCSANYEYADGECKPCSRLNDTETETITGGTRTRSVTYNSTAGGSCTATYGNWSYSCSANYEYAEGECKPCSRLNDTETEDITGGTRSRSVTYNSTAGNSCTASYGNWSYSCNAHYELDSGECKLCSLRNTTQTETITGGTRTRSVTYDSPAGGSCTASYGTWTPNCTATGYHASGEECAPNEFTVTYNGNSNTGGTKPSNHTCTYGQTCTAASKGSLVKTNYDFGGWTITCKKSNNSSCTPSKSSVAGGGDITNVTSENGATITLTAVWNETASNCQDGEYFNGTACTSCPSGYDHSDGDRSSQSTCYKSCTKTCSGQATCPSNATCTYDTSVSTSGNQHYDGSCDATDPGVCPVADFTCNACTTGTGAATCNVSKGTNSCSYTGTCSTGYTTPTASGSTVSCSACSDGYYYDAGICTSCTAVSCSDRTGTESCVCSCEVANGLCTCSGGQQSYTDSCRYTNGAGGTNGAATCTGEEYTRETTGACTGTNTITCNKNFYLDDGACSACPSAFPNTASTGQTTVTACYISCTTSDVAGSTAVSGVKYSNAAGTGVGEKTCTAMTCDSNHCLANGENGLKICVEKPEHGQCSGDPDNPIQCDQGYHLEEGLCIANTYTVTYSCGTGTGTPPANGNATYDASFTPASGSSCTKENFVFTGWTVSGTTPVEVKAASTSFTWSYLENKTFTAKYQETANNCTEGQFFNGTTCESCPDGYTSNPGASGIGECFTTCNTASCKDPGKPANTTSTGYWYSVSQIQSIQYYGGECIEATEYCDYNDINCKSNYYLNLDIWTTSIDEYGRNIRTAPASAKDMACLACSSLADGAFPACSPNSLSVRGGGPELCHTRGQQILCEELLPYPQHASLCSYIDYQGVDISSVNAASYFPDSILKADTYQSSEKDEYGNYIYKPKGCYMATCTCEPGYVFVPPVAGDATDPGACVPDIYEVTLDDNGGTGGDGVIYEKYSVGWYASRADAEAETNAITSVTKPTLDSNHSFLGYFDAQADNTGNVIIPATRILSNSTALFADTTLYAHWSEDSFTCTEGKTSTGATCPAGSYCPGGSVQASLKADPVYGCARTCPTDPRDEQTGTGGGTVTSPEGSNLITQCKTTRNNVALDDGTGAGDQTCFYDEAAAKYSNSCKIAITSCIEGRYREAEASITCAVVGRGAYSPADDIEQHLCSALTGADETVTTDSDTSAAATACYNICSDIPIANGSRVTTNAKEFYNGTEIPACTYTTTCLTGYGATGITCTPNVYEITLDHNNAACTSNCTVPASPIYLKYNTGWYANRADAESEANAIQGITPPNWPGEAFGGYWSENERIIDTNGTLTTLFTVFADDTTITASWETKPVVPCEAGTYYEGTGTTCTDCPAGSYCPGTSPIQDIGVISGLMACPTETNTYTPATDANGDALTVTITSSTKSKAISYCYAENVAFNATQGAGSQTCHYNAATAKYTDDCSDKQILTCSTGHWLANPTDIDCSEVTAGYYSPNIVLTRTECPNRNEDNTITTQGTTSGAVSQCYRGNIWYEPTNGHSGHRRNCYHKPDETDTNIETGYTYNCDVSVIVACDAGYYDDGSYVNGNSERDCKEVGTGYFSPAQTGCTGEELQPSMSNIGCSTQRTECPAGTGATDVVSTDPTTATTTSDVITACYLTCNATKNLNGTIVNVTNSPVHFNTTKNAYDTCIYDSDTCPEDMWCDTDGFHDCPADKDGTAGKADLVPNQKYRGIETCYVLYNPFVVTENYNHVWEHGTGWVKAFYEGTEANGDYTNYYNVGALTCDAGYYYDSSIFCSGVNTCYYSPAQTAYPSETPTMDNPGSSISAIACPAGCSGSESYAYSYEQCYKACDLTTAAFAHSKTVVPVSDTVTGASASTYNDCAYNITCVTGYDVQGNGTPNPSCVAHEYTITLDKNGGSGSTPASVNCVFNSGACALPEIVDTRTGYSTANKWCTNADGSGTCYDAGTTVETNISANASDTALYAQWTPNIYMITLNHNSAATAGAPATVYLKYATGWYSDASATTSITQMTTLPVKGVMTFVGYAPATGFVFADGVLKPSSYGEIVIDSNGNFITSEEALTFTTQPKIIYAQWSDAPITCPAGTYYAGRGEDPTNPDVCKTCEENNYCEGTTVDTNSGQAGLNACPDGGKSPAGSDEISDCYKELLPTYEANHGHGTQTCYYDNEAHSYSARCKDFVITSCNAGYWLAGESDIDCSEADVGYYSGDDELIRHQCPNGGTTKSDNKTAESIYECYKTGLDYTAPDSSGSGTQSCWYSSGEGDSAVYGRECFDQAITKCRGGYYRANTTDVTCTEVGQNNYSPEDDIERHACPDGGKTNGITTADIGLCFKDGLEYEATHGGGSQTCNWNDNPQIQAYNIGCGDKKITWCEGGYWLADAQALDCVPVGYDAYSPNRDTNRYACQPGTITLTETSDSEDDCFECPEDHVCNPDIGKKTCAELTNGQYTKSDAGTSDPAYCWAECVATSPAAEMDGRDYNNNDSGSPFDTCVITKCEPGYFLNFSYAMVDGRILQIGQCTKCPAGSYCDGTRRDDCPESHPNSDTGNSSVDLCYTECEATSPAATMSGRDNYGVADTCEITSCEAGYYLDNGACVICPAGSYCDGTHKTDCPAPYTQSDVGVSSANYCYKECDNAANATAMSGRDYNNNGGGEPADTCEIVSCGTGYMFNADRTQCIRCTAGNYCDGTDGGNGDGSTSCPADWPNSVAGATQKSQCYRECTEHDENDCHLVPEGGSAYNAYWDNKCRYTATVNGNPADYDENTGMCTMTGCRPGYEMIAGVCELCGREHALSYKEEGICMVSTCEVGYHPKADQCESDLLECTEQAPNSTYAEQKWNGTLGAFEICTIKSCEEDYHLASNACVANEQVCNVPNGVGVKTWNPDTKTWNPCEATSCAPGYTNDPYEKNNASEQCSECRNKFSILGEIAVSGYLTGCEIATCMYQGEKYNLDNNECVPICDKPYSDETGSLRWNESTKKCERTCNPGYVSW